jgi:hypothetical protein
VVTFLSFSADGKTLAYGLWPYPGNRRRYKGAAVVWDRVARKEIFRVQGLVVDGALAGDGKTLAVHISNTSISLWDVARGKKLRDCEGSKASPSPSRLAFLPGGRILAGCFWNGDLFLWKVATGEIIRRFGSARGGVDYFTVSGHGRHILAHHHRRRLVKYNPRLHRGMMPKGGMVLIVENTSRLWDVSTGKEVCQVADTTYRPSYRGTWGQFSATGGSLHGFRVRVAANGQALFCPLPGRFPLQVTATHREGVTLRDAGLGKTLRRLKEVPRSGVESVVFSPDGRRLAVLTSNPGPPEGTAALIYDVSDLVEKERARAARLSAQELEALWKDLARPARAGRAMLSLGLLPRPTLLAFVKDHLSGLGPPDPAQVARLVAGLDHSRYKVRSRSQAALQRLGPEVAPALRQALKAGPSLEQRKRLKKLLAQLKHQPVSGETRRGLCVIDLLEHQDSQEARNLLKRLARRARGTWLAEEARAALRRTG